MASSTLLPTKMAGMLTSTEKSRRRCSPRRKICLPNRQRLQSPRFSPQNLRGKVPDCGECKGLIATAIDPHLKSHHTEHDAGAWRSQLIKWRDLVGNARKTWAADE